MKENKQNRKFSEFTVGCLDHKHSLWLEFTVEKEFTVNEDCLFTVYEDNLFAILEDLEFTVDELSLRLKSLDHKCLVLDGKHEFEADLILHAVKTPKMSLEQ